MKAMVLDIEDSLRQQVPFEDYVGDEHKRANAALKYASYFNLNKKECMILDHLDRKMIQGINAPDHWGNTLLMSPSLKMQSFLKLATFFNLSGYVSQKLFPPEEPHRVETASSLLRSILPRQPWTLKAGSSDLKLKTEMVSTLIRYGADPNWKTNEPDEPNATSAWDNILRHITIFHDPRFLPEPVPYIYAMKFLVRGGADPRI